MFGVSADIDVRPYSVVKRPKRQSHLKLLQPPHIDVSSTGGMTVEALGVLANAFTHSRESCCVVHAGITWRVEASELRSTCAPPYKAKNR